MNNIPHLKFKLFANCVSVKGYKRGIMYDLNRKWYRFIPNSMIDFIEESEGKNKDSILTTYSEEFHNIIDEYFDFLETNDFIFWMPASLFANFPKLNLEWDYPGQISNAIIDIDENSRYNVIGVLSQLERLGCKHIQIRSYCKKNVGFYDEILSQFTTSSYLSVEIITQHIEGRDESEIKELINKHKRVKAIVFHSAPVNKIVNETALKSMGNIAYTSQKIKSPKDCYNNTKAYFNVSVQFFTEAQLHHSYFNRKIAIDTEGNIKNCSSHDIKYGDVNTHKIADIIANAEFQKLWFVKKDETEICKDCEFRYMCVDSRLPKQKKDGTWYHETECNYNPYIAKWQGEKDYISIKEYIEVP